MKYYSGIGARSSPLDICKLMANYAEYLVSIGYILRSGGASGADNAFETGCDAGNGRKEIYLPWPEYNGNKSTFYDIPPYAYQLAAEIHPVWNKLKFSVKNLHARNCQILLGKDLKTPSEFVVCWTPGGKICGGTATAINLALKNNIPVYNLAIKLDKEILDRDLENLKQT